VADSELLLKGGDYYVQQELLLLSIWDGSIPYVQGEEKKVIFFSL
jgi:hypothetical protein